MCLFLEKRTSRKTILGYAIQRYSGDSDAKEFVAGLFYRYNYTVEKKNRAKNLYDSDGGFYGYFHLKDAYASWKALKKESHNSDDPEFMKNTRIVACTFEGIIGVGSPNIGINSLDEGKQKGLRARYRTVTKVFPKDFKLRKNNKKMA